MPFLSVLLSLIVVNPSKAVRFFSIYPNCPRSYMSYYSLLPPFTHTPSSSSLSPYPSSSTSMVPHRLLLASPTAGSSLTSVSISHATSIPISRAAPTSTLAPTTRTSSNHQWAGAQRRQSWGVPGHGGGSYSRVFWWWWQPKLSSTIDAT